MLGFILLHNVVTSLDATRLTNVICKQAKQDPGSMHAQHNRSTRRV